MLRHDDIDWKWHRWRQVSKDQFSPRKENTWKGSHSGQKNGKIVRNTIGWIIRLGTGMIHISVPYSHLTWIWNRKWTASLYPSFTSRPYLDDLSIFYPIIKYNKVICEYGTRMWIIAVLHTILILKLVYVPPSCPIQV